MKLKNLQHPVPQDIEIAQAAEPVFIGQIAADLGIEESELNLHGKHKAKVCTCHAMPCHAWCSILCVSSKLSSKHILVQVELTVLDRLKGRPDGQYGECKAVHVCSDWPTYS